MASGSDQEPARDAGRRRFLDDTMRAVGGVAIAGLILSLYAQRSRALPSHAIRPPGALPEETFLGACIRCGLCVRDCRYEILQLGQLGNEVPAGTPYFTARTGPCEMCEDIPCIPACPTDALDHSLTDINQATMGLAVLTDEENCLAFLGLRCEVCFNVCPVRDDAISLEHQHNQRSGKHARFIPVVHSTGCTGCGRCERACILEEAAIRVFPPQLVKGALGTHYRLGWEEKAKAGRALVTPDTPHQYNLPEGMRYDPRGRGLIMNESIAPTAPFASDPLETLNQGLENRR